jgi:hypothetical protein
MTLDSSGNLGLGVTPSAWGGSFKAFQIASGGTSLWSDGSVAFYNRNTFYDGTNRKYVVDGFAQEYAQLNDGSHAWKITTSGSANGNISFTQAMTLDASGNLLVGTTSALGVIGEKVTIANNNNTVLSIVATNDTTPSLQFRSNSVDRLTIDSSSTFGAYFNVRSNQDIRFGTNNTERARISSDGTFRVKGAGTAGSTDAFQVSGSAPASAMTLDASGRLGLGATSPGTNLHIGTGSSPENLGVTLSRGATTNFYLAHDGTKTFIAGIDPANDGPKIGSLNSYPFLFVTGNTERARITSGGDLLVGTTSATSRSGITAKTVSSAVSSQDAISAQTNSNSYFTVCSHVSTTSGTRYHIGFGDGTTWTERGTISTDGTSTSYNTSSDYRLKNITGPVTNSGAYIDALKPVEGTWKADGSTFVGLIAHEVQEVSRTNIATGTKDGERMQGMDYSASEIIANLIAEVKSLRARVAQLEAK